MPLLQCASGREREDIGRGLVRPDRSCEKLEESQRLRLALGMTESLAVEMGMAQPKAASLL